MTDATYRKGSLGLGFLNPFRSSSRPGSRSSSRANSISDFVIDDVRRDSKSALSSTTKLRKGSAPGESRTSSYASSAKLSLEQSRTRGSRHISLVSTRNNDEWDVDKNTGERKDYTDMIHSLAHRDSAESLVEKTQVLFSGIPRQSAVEFFTRLPEKVWVQVVQGLDMSDNASLAFSCKPFRDLIGVDTWKALANQDNLVPKKEFLMRLDETLPSHILCFQCVKYHLRTQKGKEMLRPANVSNPIFDCPKAHSLDNKMSRARITVGRTLPFPFTQLAVRAHRYTPEYGIPLTNLARRWKDRDGEWTHTTQYTIVNNHLLLRVVSWAFATADLPAAGLRKLFYAHADNFTPYFSVCAHWRDGNLMPSVKCAMSHLYKAPEGSGVAGMASKVNYRLHRPNPVITLCADCKPMRRCPTCPSEYLIEMRMQEDKTDPTQLFKHAIVVTRWSDLGDASSPQNPEWASVIGEGEYDSFTAIGKRAISGVFESQFTVEQIPPQRIVSMNPNLEKLGEAGHNWY